MVSWQLDAAVNDHQNSADSILTQSKWNIVNHVSKYAVNVTVPSDRLKVLPKNYQCPGSICSFFLHFPFFPLLFLIPSISSFLLPFSLICLLIRFPLIFLGEETDAFCSAESICSCSNSTPFPSAHHTSTNPFYSLFFFSRPSWFSTVGLCLFLSLSISLPLPHSLF